MAESFNPFEHHHDHDHDEGPLDVSQLDPAQQSLADALRVSFALLKIVMLVLMVVYVFSGIFSVSEQQVAVVLRFGKVVGAGDEAVIPPGGPHFALPYPIHQVVRVPTNAQRIDINRAFWFEVKEGQEGLTLAEIAGGRTGPLNPEKDGSLLTGDANIVHAEFSVAYRVDAQRAVNYVENVEDPALAERVVRAAAEQALVAMAAGRTHDDVFNGRIERERTLAAIQTTLTRLKTGIVVEDLSVKRATMPLAVRDAYEQVLKAESSRANEIEKAQQERAKILGGTAGTGWEALWEIVQAYERARQAGDAAASEVQRKRLAAALDPDTMLVKDATGREHRIGGEVSQAMVTAHTEASQIKSEIASEADRVAKLAEAYAANRTVFRSRYWEDARQSILGSDIETFYLPPGQTYIEVNRDPAVKERREQEAIRKATEAAEAGSGGPEAGR